MLGLDTRGGRAVKRLMDVVCAGLGLAFLSPVFLVLALTIKWSSRGPVFFRQARVGRDGIPFRIWKFRTMVVEAERLGPGVTVGGDKRVTPVGRFMRASKLDEFPQLINVLVGQMSLVGPRPELPSFVEFYTESERRVLRFRPGITDPASLRYRDEEEVLAGAEEPLEFYRDVVMREKIRLNLEYQERASVFSDLGLVVKTAFAVAFPRSPEDVNASQPRTRR